jgi:cold shock CspA family protein
MDIFQKMQQMAKGKVTSEKKVALPGDIIQGMITNIPEDKITGKLKGYFFISSDDLPFERIFAHWSGLRQDTLRLPELRKRMKVEFELKYDEEDGYKAIKVKVIE